MKEKSFENFQEGFYSYEGELVYIVKQPHNLLMKFPGSSIATDGTILGGQIIYADYNEKKANVDLNLLESVEPYDFLIKKHKSLVEFIKSIEKQVNKANLSELEASLSKIPGLPEHIKEWIIKITHNYV